MLCCCYQYCTVEKGNQGAGQNHAHMTVYSVVQTLYKLVLSCVSSGTFLEF